MYVTNIYLKSIYINIIHIVFTYIDIYNWVILKIKSHDKMHTNLYAPLMIAHLDGNKVDCRNNKKNKYTWTLFR